MANKKRILFFDDEPFISDILAQSLRLFDWDVTLVSDIDVLFQNLHNSSRPYEIIVLDIMAPIPKAVSEYVTFTKKEINDMDNGMNTGIVVAKKVWDIENHKYQNIPILFLSARKDPRPENPILQTDKCDYVSKPELAKAIDDRLKKMLNYNNKK